MKIEKFEDIQAWQRARELVSNVYVATNTGDFAKDFTLKDQIRRAIGFIKYLKGPSQ